MSEDKQAANILEGFPPLREVIRKHNLRAEKALGQNFLLDLNITDKIARLAGDLSGVNVIEIGPGPGGLTRSLLKTGARSVTAIEFDPRAVTALSDLQAAFPERLRILQQDALLSNLIEIVPPPRAVVANLPYNIATPLLLRWLEQIRADHGSFQSLTLMFQKEVAARITSTPGNKAYGRLAVMAQWLCSARKVMDLPPSAFTPPPKVSSSIVHFTPLKPQEGDPDFADVERITAAAFGQRRKMIRSSLSDYEPFFSQASLRPELRAENISPQSYIALALLARAKDSAAQTN